MTLDEARKIAEALDEVAYGFIQVTLMRFLNRAFPEFHWSFADGAFHVSVEERSSHAGLVLRNAPG